MDVFDLQAKIRLDDSAYKSGLSAIKGTLADFAKFSAATLGAAATGVSAIVKESVSAYADYEQLAGGIETLFGSSADTVMKNAEKAYQTAGQSMNEYMETSIQSAAALINSLGGDQAKAAELMDLSITDMADNVNKMGTNMEAVQNAYRGFSRQNFTMLDNLALGFAGTKQGMQDLLDKAQEISGIEYDISSYSDIVQAIHVVQEEMGITGTTAKEASGTISGSIGSVKAAWENLKVEISKDDGNVGEAFDKLSETAGAAFDNMLPRVEKALDGVGDLIVKGAPKIGKSISKIIPKITPPLMEASVSIVGALGTGIIENIPTLLQTGGEVIGMLGDTIESNLPKLKDTAFSLVSDFSGYLKDNLPTLIPEGVNAVVEFAKGITDPSNTGTLIDAAFDIIDGLIEGFTSEDTINAIVEGAPVIVENLVDGIVKAGDRLADAALSICESLIDYFGEEENREKLKDASDKILTSLIDGFASLLAEGGKFAYKLGGMIAEQLGLGDYWKVGNDVLSEWWDGFKEKWEEFKGWFGDEIQLTLNPVKLGEQVGEKVTNVVVEGVKGGKAKRSTPHKRNAKGGIFYGPTYDRFGDLYGEAGTEMLLPLDTNTSWMDKFANKLISRMGAGDRYYTINVYADSLNNDADFEKLVDKIDERLGEKHIREYRAIGGTGYSG